MSSMDSLIRTIDASIANKDYSSLVGIFNAARGTWQNVGHGEQRSLAAYFIQQMVSTAGFLPGAFSNEELVAAMLTALGHLPAVVEHAADNVLRQQLFEYKIQQSNPDYADAARILAGMRMDDDLNSVYYMDAAQKADILVKVAECFLAEDEIAESDAAVTKAGSVVESIPNKEQHVSLILRYKSTYARVLDANRKFLAACQRYYDLSTADADPEDLIHLLGRAATCAILAPSGPQRERLLSQLAQDERLNQLDHMPEFATHATIVRKMVTRSIVDPAELTQFESSLAPHQRAVRGDGLTILERAVVEHNMIAVSTFYQKIYFSELAPMLGVSVRKAEQIAGIMIMDGFLPGSIDQVEGMLEFDDATADNGGIPSFCQELQGVSEKISSLKLRQPVV